MFHFFINSFFSILVKYLYVPQSLKTKRSIFIILNPCLFIVRYSNLLPTGIVKVSIGSWNCVFMVYFIDSDTSTLKKFLESNMKIQEGKKLADDSKASAEQESRVMSNVCVCLTPMHFS